MEAFQAYEDLETQRHGFRHWYPLTGGDRNPRSASQEHWREDRENPLLSVFLLFRLFPSLSSHAFRMLYSLDF